ncbi:MAG TPA: pyrroloquinoline quinone biosynthesis protein PqqB [Gemmatimonadaceae bacterium]
MHVLLLGTAAGGGFPQWNCLCPVCRAARDDPAAAHPRTQSSIALSADGTRWFLCNASPDVREQLARLPLPLPLPLSDPRLPPGPEGTRERSPVRRVPIEGIVLTDAELDHSLGLALLREARDLRLWATEAVIRTLERDSRLLPVTRAFASVRVTELRVDSALELRDASDAPTGLEVEPFLVAGDPPRFATADEPGHSVGLLVRDRATGGRCAYVPACGALDPPLLARLADADLVLFDGTCWTDDELQALGIGTRGATEMGHLPISGPNGSLEPLSRLSAARVVYTHINNTNPILLEHSEARRAVERAGLTVGMDGMRFRL